MIFSTAPHLRQGRSTASWTRPSTSDGQGWGAWTRICDKGQHFEQLLYWIVAFACWILGFAYTSHFGDCNFCHTFRYIPSIVCAKR